MTNEMNDVPEVVIDESVVLRKFDGDAHPDNEVERLVINNGIVAEHVIIENGEVVGRVQDGNLEGSDVGRLIPSNE